jgi:5-methylcytosine-specific restriction endonuclease McrA
MDRSLREQVWHRALRRCEYCQMTQDYDDIPIAVDHVVAASHGGATFIDNLALA